MPLIDVHERHENLPQLEGQNGTLTPPKKRGVLASDRIKEVISSRDIHYAYVT